MPLTESAGVYRRLEEHFARYVREYEERFEPREGSLRKVVPTAVEAYLACGRLEGGFARIRCPNCRAEHLLAFSCRTRNFCPGCQSKRSALFAEHVVTESLEPDPHRHVVHTIPRVLRGLFQRERGLLGLLGARRADGQRPRALPDPRASPNRRRRESQRRTLACAHPARSVHRARGEDPRPARSHPRPHHRDPLAVPDPSA